jgi:ABC-2 type transport system permease protein
MSASAKNLSMVRHLVLKDWHFNRWAILGYLAAGALSLLLLALGSEWWFYAGSILLITVLITVGIHLPMATIINERKEQTLAFVMSLPISHREYTTAKILANLLIVLLPWAALTFGCLALLAVRTRLSAAGLIPFAAVALTEILVGSCLMVAVALVSESLEWTVGAIVLTNLMFQGFLYWVSHIPSMAAAMKSGTVTWSALAIELLLGEAGAILLLLGLTFYLQSRKKDFL